MGKTRRLMALALRKRLILPALGTSIAVIGSISAMLGIVDLHLGLLATAGLAAVVLVLSAAFQFRRLNLPQVAVDDVIAPNGDDYPKARRGIWHRNNRTD
jgi:hypothetical protein